ncbi:hypothetical protein V5F34_18000 [Xanthobacter autotrophicus]|uniref:beta family protein n=1 Tax=Xanthobacter autotrophicus TaxID=280 RepID=UPI003729F0DB
MTVDLSSVNYVPVISIRPAEMRAIFELPNRCKDELLPFVIVKPWASALKLESAIEQVGKAVGDRPWIADISAETAALGPRRPVHHEIEALQDPSDGYKNWCAFVERYNNIIPCAQISHLNELPVQIGRLQALGRGVVLRLKEGDTGNFSNIVNAAAEEVERDNLLIVIDYEQRNKDLLSLSAKATGLLNTLSKRIDGANVCVSASTFPFEFRGTTNQEIFERSFYKIISSNKSGTNLIYSDHASTRAESMQAGGGKIYPRIDYPLDLVWEFRRSIESSNGLPLADKLNLYSELARALMKEAIWDSRLRLWGVQMIELAADGDPQGLSTPARCTAVRINIHLHRQLFYGKPDDQKYDTEEDWSD